MDLLTKCKPNHFSDLVGQKNLIGENGILTNMLKQNNIQSSIFYGPPGTEKTTTAMILAKESNLPFAIINGINFSTTEFKQLLNQYKQTFLLYLDEIQYLNKKQQQTLLPFIENKQIILIASTTDNPYFAINDALLSRCIVLEFKPLSVSDIQKRLTYIIQTENYSNISDNIINMIAKIASGDIRRAINLLSLVISQYSDHFEITAEDIKYLLPSVMTANFDKNAEYHYQYIAALQKSIRGSDPDASVFWLMKLLLANDLKTPIRRILVIMCEDIGLASPNILPQIIACIEAAERLGLPEAFYPLTEAVLILALAPKSNSVGEAFKNANNYIQNGYGVTVPKHIREEYPVNYSYPHNYPNHWIKQQYLPDDLNNNQTVIYTAGDNDFEQRLKSYWQQIKHCQFPQ